MNNSNCDTVLVRLACDRIVGSILFLALLPGFTTAGQGANHLSDEERRSGWELLFDGATTEGWRTYRQPDLNDDWRVQDGTLTSIGDQPQPVVTVGEWASFELSLEYRLPAACRVGICYHVSEETQHPSDAAAEVPLGRDTAEQETPTAGGVAGLWTARTRAAREAGEWNEVRLQITPQKCVHFINGLRTARYVKGDEKWQAQVAGSKFAEQPMFGKAPSGHLSFIADCPGVSFRNIKIRSLDGQGREQSAETVQLPLRVEAAFPDLTWNGWSGSDPQGRPQELRPIVLTHPGDGTERVVVATQRGVVHIFSNRPDVSLTQRFLDIQDRVRYRDNENEEGLLGLAFHPRYAENGQLYVYYTSRDKERTSVVSRFRVSPDDPNRAVADSEEEILRVAQPYWNHNGGTLAFGPDGFLYIALGDGGAANDPLESGQDLGTWLGSILRIDVDRQQSDKSYAIPADNPFVHQASCRGEIWAYGFRNVWRMAFDRQTGELWAADVGQNLWEEINLVQRGGNYGWNLREGGHPFGSQGAAANEKLIEPIWEYDHGVGKSITGGLVYRGSRIPALQGAYVYADYVSGRIWALFYDRQRQRVLANRLIVDGGMPVLSFGEDSQGELYFLTATSTGQGIFRFTPN